MAGFPMTWKTRGILLTRKTPGRFLEFCVRPGMFDMKSFYAEVSGEGIWVLKIW